MCYWRVTNDDLQSRRVRKLNWATWKSLAYTDGKHDRVRRKWQKFMSSLLWQCVNTSTPGKRNQKTKSCWNEMFIRHNQNEGCREQDGRGWLVIKDVNLRAGLALNHSFQFCRFSRGTAPRNGFVKLRLIYAKWQTFRNIKRHDSYSTAFTAEQRQVKEISLRMW